MVPRSLTGLHVIFPMRGGVARDVLAADVANRDLHGGVDGDALGPCGLVHDPNLLGVLDPLSLWRALCGSGGVRIGFTL